jgi:hypothetical protein
MNVNPIFIAGAVIDSVKVLRMAATVAKTKKQRQAIEQASQGLLGLALSVHDRKFYTAQLQRRVSEAVQAIQGFQVEFPTQIMERDYFDPRAAAHTARACIQTWEMAARVAKTAEEKKTIEMGAMGMSKVVSLPVNCGYYSDEVRWTCRQISLECEGFAGKTEAIREANYTKLLRTLD